MAGPTEDPFVLRAAAGQAALRPAPYGSTDVWSYNGFVPGPEIRVRQGDRIRVLAQNGLNGDDIPEDQRPERLPEHARPRLECFDYLVHSACPIFAVPPDLRTYRENESEGCENGTRLSADQIDPDRHPNPHDHHHQIFRERDKAKRHIAVTTDAGAFQFTLVDIDRLENRYGSNCTDEEGDGGANQAQYSTSDHQHTSGRLADRINVPV